MTANAEIVLEEHENSVIVPEAAVTYDAQKNASIDVADPASKTGRRRIAVKLGVGNGTKVQVLEGLKEGDKYHPAVVTARARMREAIIQSLENLRANKLRSFLTMFGIMWGMISVVVLSATGEGFRRGNEKVLRELGKNVGIIWGGRTSMQAGGERAGRRIFLTLADARAIAAESTMVAVVSPEIERVPARVVVLVGLVTWWLVGRALHPVERMRQEVEEISHTTLHRHVDEPATGDEVARLAHTMNDMLDRLEAAQTTQRRFVSDASHELRSPLATIRTSVEVAQLHPRGADWPDVATTVLHESERLDELVADLLALAKIDETGGSDAPAGRGIVDLDEVVLADVARHRSLGHTVRAEGCRRPTSRATRSSCSGSCATCSTTPRAMPRRW